MTAPSQQSGSTPSQPLPQHDDRSAARVLYELGRFLQQVSSNGVASPMDRAILCGARETFQSLSATCNELLNKTPPAELPGVYKSFHDISSEVMARDMTTVSAAQPAPDTVAAGEAPVPPAAASRGPSRRTPPSNEGSTGEFLASTDGVESAIELEKYPAMALMYDEADSAPANRRTTKKKKAKKRTTKKKAKKKAKKRTTKKTKVKKKKAKKRATKKRKSTRN